VPRRLRAPAVAVGAMVLLSAAVRFAVARSFDVPWIAPDEMIYGLVGESLWESGELTVRGLGIPYYSVLTPALVGLPLTLDDLDAGVAIAQALQALAMSLVAIPVYVWGKRLMGAKWALPAAGLALLPPALWYGGLLMTEALFYTLVTAALLTLARMLEEATLERQGLFLLMLTAAAAVRLQALLLLPALVLAAGLHAWFGRSWDAVRLLAPLLALTGVAAVATLVAYGDERGDLLGAYGSIAEASSSSAGALSQLTWHSGALVVMSLGLPLLATATLAVLAAMRGEPDPPVRAFLATTSAYVVLLVAQVSAFAVGHLDRVSERYLATALPPLLLGLCVWISRGAPRPWPVALPLAAVSVIIVLALPGTRLATRLGAHDALTAISLIDLAERSEVAFRAGLALFALVAAAVFVFVPRRALPVATGALAVGFVVLSALAAREIDRFSEIEHARDLGAADPRWIDRAGVAPVLLIDTGQQPSTSVARTAFWNRSVRRLVRLEDVPSQALPQVPVSIRRDGALVDAGAREVSEAHVAVPTAIAMRGERLASAPATDVAYGSTLWRVDEPLRLVSRAEGFTPVGDFAHGRVVVYRCGEGELALTLLGKDGLPVRIRVDGFPSRTVELEPGGVWRGSVEPLVSDGTSPCVFELVSEGLVGSTRVEWVPSAEG
jgi:hypothetical protein